MTTSASLTDDPRQAHESQRDTALPPRLAAALQELQQPGRTPLLCRLTLATSQEQAALRRALEHYCQRRALPWLWLPLYADLRQEEALVEGRRLAPDEATLSWQAFWHLLQGTGPLLLVLVWAAGQSASLALQCERLLQTLAAPGRLLLLLEPTGARRPRPVRLVRFQGDERDQAIGDAGRSRPAGNGRGRIAGGSDEPLA
jgi:hypothetical protein